MARRSAVWAVASPRIFRLKAGLRTPPEGGIANDERSSLPLLCGRAEGLFLLRFTRYDLSMSEDHADIDFILHEWPFKPGVIAARLVRAGDGREVIQMRMEMGLLQMETAGRPDGEHPGGVDNCLEWLSELARVQGEAFAISEVQCQEVDREIVQFYHRRICCLALRQFGWALADADYALRLMDFIAGHSLDSEWVFSHERYRPFVLFHRIQAAAMLAVQQSGAEAAIETINRGLDEMREVFARFGAEEQFEQDELVAQLGVIKESLREEYRVGKTLAEQLADAVAAEEYERAARLRDEIAKRRG
jgi:hypothetical protein